MPEKVLIADDHPIFRRGVTDVLEENGGFEVIAEAGDGTETLRMIREHGPDVVVLDISMPGADGLDVIAQATRWPDTPRFVVLTMHDDVAWLRRAFELGASGYLLKDHAEEELINCLETVSAGRCYVGSGLPWQLDADGGIEIPDPLESLSPAERRVLRLVAEYKSSKEIADLLNVSVRTVDNHRAHIADKLNLQGPNALLRFALEHK